jgi:hypothetical protein
MATTTPSFGWPVPTSGDLVKNGATAIEALGDAIDASMAELKGGTTGQVLSKTSNTDMDFTWVAQDDSNAIQNSIVDAKGDLISATANDTPARLAVGNNGETLVADSSTSTGLRYTSPVGSLANPVINGGLDIWQRGTSFTAATVYSADRWITSLNTGQTISRQTTSDTTNLPNIQYAVRCARNSGSTASGLVGVSNSMETVNAIPFAGKTVTLSFYARVGANFSAGSGSAFTAEIRTGTGTDQRRDFTGGYTGETVAMTTTPTLTTTWQRFAVTGTIASTATEFAVMTYYGPGGTSGANDWFEVTGVQVDVGTYTSSSAPTFRRAGGTIQGELSAAQRYYYRETGANAGDVTTGFGQAYSTTNTYAIFKPKVTMRVTPTSIDYSNLRAENGVSAVNITSASLWGASTSNAPAILNTTGGTFATTTSWYLGFSAAGYIGFSAEL